ncbi:hypothetical protein Lal_00021145 [Lupinus albus]|uniref:Putative transcription factor C2H2 family n=1 Tax=Lupinus albus TaxID=3870 RepID=A0A6A4QA25_LUPAL|nr:putative transcription factor C2H2 family [Lupinus albus]KAF1876587.1 hypothetical protein Lal_00021145 [Lupinus albus]
MALIVGQQSNFKHFCKICKKGFGCGRALGGHMRAHGIGDETAHMDDDDDDDDPEADWEERLGGNVSPSNKRMYALRTNPNRSKSCRVCKNCGKEFLSWKSFLEHGKCTSEDAESLVSSPTSDDGGDDDDNGVGRRGCGWSKRKRSFRAKVGNCPSSEDEDLANCLMMLSNAIVDPLVAEPEEFCASASKDEERRNHMNFIAPLSCPLDNKAKGVANGLFECKACKKVFNSHQALGGHRASHKKVKGCFAARLDNFDDSFPEDDAITHEDFFTTKSNSTLQFDHGSTLPSSSSKRKSKVHECSICHRSFSSGQALGGHKRCHWITSSNGLDTSTLARFQQFQDHIEQIPKFDSSSEPLDLKLDLNLPASTNELARRNNVSTEILMQQPWVGIKDIIKDDDNINNSSHCQNQHQQPNQIDNNNNDEDKSNNISNTMMQNDVDNEDDCNVKLAKLSELKDMNNDGSSSPWLQVGFSSTTNVGREKS